MIDKAVQLGGPVEDRWVVLTPEHDLCRRRHTAYPELACATRAMTETSQIPSDGLSTVGPK
jgi:hypothetical protein